MSILSGCGLKKEGKCGEEVVVVVEKSLKGRVFFKNDLLP
jgi:hypothetical protein